MTDASDADEAGDDLRPAVESFLDDVRTTLDEYDQGYADADATLSVLRSHLNDLAAAVEES